MHGAWRMALLRPRLRPDVEEPMRSRFMRYLLLGLVTILAAASGAAQAVAVQAAAATVPAAYRIVRLAASNAASQPAINNQDQVAFSVPDAAGVSRAKFYDGHTVLDIGTLGGPQSVAIAVNDLGQVAGHASLASGVNHAFLWSRTSGIIDIGPSGPGTGESVANDLNNRGQVVGYAVRGDSAFAFLWCRTTGLLDLGQPGAFSTDARAINEAGQVAVRSAGLGGYIWSKGHDIVRLGQGTYPNAINERGEVAGSAVGSSSYLAPAVWTPRDGLILLGEGGINSEAYDINDKGLLVAFDTSTSQGFAWSREAGVLDIGTGAMAIRVNNRGQAVGGAGGHAILWTRNGGIVDLNTRIPHAPPGFMLQFAYDISDNGAIVAASTSGLVLLLPVGGASGAPAVGPVQSSGAAAVDHLLSFSASFQDANPGDTHKATWSWGDGRVETGIVSESRGTGSVSGQHTFRAAGVYTVRLAVTDSGGNSTTVQRTVTVCAGAP
jgi:probable HAF family extracellular repeat protein